MTPQQIARLEKQLQQNHVGIQRLWKAAFEKPEPYVGIPLAVVPGGLTTDTTDTTPTTSTTTTTTTTRTLPPPDPCANATFDVTVYWSPTVVCAGIPHCPSATTVAAVSLQTGGSSETIVSPCRHPFGSGIMTIQIVAHSYLCLVNCHVWGPYCGVPGSAGGQLIYEGSGRVSVGETIILSRIFTYDAGCYSCLPSLVIATRTS